MLWRSFTHIVSAVGLNISYPLALCLHSISNKLMALDSDGSLSFPFFRIMSCLIHCQQQNRTGRTGHRGLHVAHVCSSERKSILNLAPRKWPSSVPLAWIWIDIMSFWENRGKQPFLKTTTTFVSLSSWKCNTTPSIILRDILHSLEKRYRKQSC